MFKKIGCLVHFMQLKSFYIMILFSSHQRCVHNSFAHEGELYIWWIVFCHSRLLLRRHWCTRIESFRILLKVNCIWPLIIEVISELNKLLLSSPPITVTDHIALPNDTPAVSLKEDFQRYHRDPMQIISTVNARIALEAFASDFIRGDTMLTRHKVNSV